MVGFRGADPFSYIREINGSGISSDVNQLVMVNGTGERVSLQTYYTYYKSVPSVKVGFK